MNFSVFLAVWPRLMFDQEDPKPKKAPELGQPVWIIGIFACMFIPKILT